MQIRSFTFNPFSENTYVLYDETNECVVVDPGCAFADEEAELAQFIQSKNLIVKQILLTHAHVDHIFGCDFVHKTYRVGITMHPDDLFMLQRGPQMGMMYGVPVKQAPEPEAFLQEGESFRFGNTVLEVLHTPGHSPGSITFVHNGSKSILSGDVLFQGSIGRWDLPGGNQEILLENIRKKLFVLPDDFQVYSGHGSPTSIGVEKKFNPFFQ